VIRYDATDFHGPDSERDLDNCLAVLSTYDVPWRFSEVGTSSAAAMWRDLGGRVELSADDDWIDVRPAKTPSCHRAWTQIFTNVFGTPSNY